jgi:Ca2+-binding RTX toxin-like protein
LNIADRVPAQKSVIRSITLGGKQTMAYEDRNIIYDDNINGSAEFLYGTAGRDIFVFDMSSEYTPPGSVYNVRNIDAYIVGFGPGDDVAFVNLSRPNVEYEITGAVPATHASNTSYPREYGDPTKPDTIVSSYQYNASYQVLMADVAVIQDYNLAYSTFYLVFDNNPFRTNGVGKGYIGSDAAVAYNGGTGIDHVSYATSPSGVFVRLDIGSGIFGDAQGDTYTSIENLMGSNHADILVGNAQGNYIYGLDGVDQLTGGAGADVLDGGAGFDFTRYELAASGVVVRLDQGGGTAGDALGDTFISIEGAVGSEHADVLVGSAQGNYIFGLGGNDWIYGFGGYDELYGGAGGDAFVFRASDLTSGVATVRDFSAAEGDAVMLEGIDPAVVSPYQSGADVVIAAAGGGGVVLAGTTLAQLEGHLLFT